MSRWVNRGAKGIALLDDTGYRTKLRYVFDIADTHLVRGGRTPLLWNLYSHEHEQAYLRPSGRYLWFIPDRQHEYC